MSANQNIIINKLNLILENQKRFGLKLASITLQLEEANETIRQLQHEQQCNVTLLKDARDESPLPSEERGGFSLKPIETSEEFETFERNLADKEQRQKYIKILSPLCSSKPGQGQTCAYKLIDALFTREFICECSWSGASRGEHSKVPMKNFMNFRKFFFEVIHMWDPTFTDDHMVTFLKTVLRNAVKRMSMKGLRQSTRRVRRSKKNGGQVDIEVMMQNEGTDSDMDPLEGNNSIKTERA
uniref:DUF4806 domain-containing protein n=1 Tax=Heliothis virescens TaxID=7102 RepID=A0A2A4K483_HELVI